MTILKTIILTLLALSLCIHAISQDSLYAKEIDSLWLHSYDKKLLSKKRETSAEIKIEFSYYKNSKMVRSITILDRSTKENLVFFFLQDKIVMISPSGQQPYFLLNDKVAYPTEFNHTSEQIRNFITKGYDYLQEAYGMIKGRNN